MNKPAVLIIGFCLAVLFGVPLFFRGDNVAPPSEAAKVIIISPHNEQIRHEFGRGFTSWHEDKYGDPAQVIWSVPGGTSEIRRMLISQYKHALETGKSPGGEADLVFGGGSYEHGVLKKNISSKFEGDEVSTTISVPATIDQSLLDKVYGENLIGDITIYDPDGYWHGLALSGFGIVYNNEVLDDLKIDSPTKWDDLCNPELIGKLALVNPAQSGSVTTAFEAILKNLGWEKGWQVLRRAAANARYFSASSLKPPADVSQGDAAMGVCIDFYGRYQAQAVKSSGGGDRVGYIDPPSSTMIDPDPISLLRGAPNEELAIRFIEYCMTREAQALWQFQVDDASSDGLGPEEFELRRMPVRREMYSDYIHRMVDQVNPYETASPAPYPDRNMRAFIAPIFSAMAMDNHESLIHAWQAIVEHPSYPDSKQIVTADDVDEPELKQMLVDFDAMPMLPTNDGIELSMDTAENRKTLKYGWLRGQWIEDGLWHPEDLGSNALKREAARFFEQNYDSIIKLHAQ
jgi:spermidine/putrescine-binding protein